MIENQVTDIGWHGVFQEALAQLRGMTSGLSRTGEPLDALQSKARELEKKVCAMPLLHQLVSRKQ